MGKKTTSKDQIFKIYRKKIEKYPKIEIIFGKICINLLKPMREIVSRMELFEFIEIIIFEESLILNEPVETWPICNCLISFHSKGKRTKIIE